MLTTNNALLRTIPKFAAFPVSVLKKNVQLIPGEKNGPRIPAAHVQCNALKRKTTVKLLKAQYNRGRSSDIATLPDGKVFKFCELASNRDDKMLDKKRFERASRCRIIQKQFTEAHSTTVVHGVTDLDHDIDFGWEVGSMTLRQILLEMKTKQDRSWPLFVSVDFDSYRNEIIAVIHNDTVSEASNILSFLPVFLEAQFGVLIWQWFSTECRAEMSAYTWDEDYLRVVSLESSDEDSDSLLLARSTAPLAAWETVDDDIVKDQADHKFDLSILFDFVPRDGKGAGSGFDDAGSLNTFATGTSQLTQNLGFLAPLPLQDTATPVDSTMRPAACLLSLTIAETSNVSDITQESNVGPILGSVSVALAPAGLGSRSSSLTHLTRRGSSEAHQHAATTAASKRMTGVSPSNG